MEDLSSRLEGIEPDENGVIPVAYISVNGDRFRVRVPVKEIVIVAGEGEHVDKGPQTFRKFWEANDFLLTCAKDAPTGGAYDKFDFKVSWVNGDSYSGRFDLEGEMTVPSLENHMRGHLEFLLENHPEMAPPESERVLVDLDMAQMRPSPAPEDWRVIRDYRTEKVTPDEPRFDRQVYDIVAERDAAPKPPTP